MARGRIYKKKGNDNWYIDYTFQGRRIRQMVGKSKKVAEAALNKRLVEVAENKHLDIKREQKIKFKDFAAEYIETYSRPSKRSYESDENNLRRLLPVFGEKYLFEITPIIVEKYKNERKRQVTSSTINRELSLLRAIFNKAIEWERFFGNNPVSKVKFFKETSSRIRYLETEEIRALLKNCECGKGQRKQGSTYSPLLKPIIITLLNTGMRKGELQNLKWRDVDFKRDIITLRNTKNGETRHIPINGTAKRALISVPKHAESPYIFCGKDGKPFNFRKAFETAIKKAGIKNFRIHDLRHTFASHLVMSGVDLNTVRDLLGHKSLAMTIRYSHLSPDHKARAVSVLSKKIGTQLAPDESEKVINNFENNVSSFAIMR